MTPPPRIHENEEALASIVEVAKDLISIPSVTGSELQIMEHVEGLLTHLGWRTERWPIKNDARFNVFAFSSNNAPKVVLTTHLDVVPAPEALFTPQVVGDVLRGRGACDTKGIAATMIQAADSLRCEGCDEVGLLFVVGEEIDSVGAQAAVPILKDRGVRYVVNGEPTEGKLVVAQKGVFAGKIVVQGKPCHSGYPALGVDANGFLIEVGHAMRAIDFGSHPIFGSSTLNIGMIRGGSAGNIVSASSELSFWVRTVGSAESARAPIESAAHEVAKLFPGIHFDLQVQVVSDPIELLPLPDFETTVFCGGSDISYYVESGARVLMFGPGSLLNAHTNDEHISCHELYTAYTAYRAMYRSLVSLP